MKNLWCLLFLMGACDNVQAQVVFTCQDLLTQIGDYYRAGVQSNFNVGGLPGQPGGPHQWNFSQPLSTNTYVLRVDTVAPSDGGQGTYFPLATYAERETVEPEVSQRWDYYQLTSTGRVYYGWYDPNTEAGGVVVFDSPVVDFPASVQLGQSWNWTADYHQNIMGLPIDVHTTVGTHVDCYGMVALPMIGVVPVLRAVETKTNEFSTWLMGMPWPMGSQVVTSYYWLARGVGKAAGLKLYGNNPDAIVELPYTNTFLRVFEASHVTDRTIADLQIQLQQGQVCLSWRSETNDPGYRVELLSALNTTNWQLRAEPTSNSWTEPFLPTEPHRFYRVLLKP